LDSTLEKGIDDIVGCLADPIIVFPGGWGDTLQKHLRKPRILMLGMNEA